MEKATIFYINEHGNNLKPQGCNNNVPFARHTVVFTQNLIAPFKIISSPHQCILNTKTSQSPNSSRVLCRLNVGGECEEMKKFRFERPLDCAATKRVTRQYGLSCPNPAGQFPRRQVAHRSRAEARPPSTGMTETHGLGRRGLCTHNAVHGHEGEQKPRAGG